MQCTAGILRRRHRHRHVHDHPREDVGEDVGLVGVSGDFPVELATGITSGKSIARVGRVGEDPREDVGVRVGVVECQLKAVCMRAVGTHQLGR